MALFHLIYASKSIGPLTENGLAQIGETARHHNMVAGITGVLMCGSGHFVQLLEGPEEIVSKLYESICTDPRHHEIELIVRRPAQERLLPEWAMGTINFDSSEGFDLMPEAKQITKVLEMCDSAESPIEIGTLLRIFRHRMMTKSTGLAA